MEEVIIGGVKILVNKNEIISVSKDPRSIPGDEFWIVNCDGELRFKTNNADFISKITGSTINI